ncbi:MAG: type II secretion system F family protein, partial [Gemmatimonadota bacterium]|nr:type II secretion system F family protein [Gemmatimonadota bacterium]
MADGRFGYRAANAAGAMVEGEIDAASEQGAVDALRRRALWVTEVWPQQAAAAARVSRALPSGALAVVTRALSTLLASGVPLDKALSYAATQSPAGQLRDAFTAVRADVRNGRALSDSFRAHEVFPSLFAALAATGEATGTLDSSLARLAEYLERRDELRARMQAALLYPSLLGGAAIVGVTVIMLVVVPRFSVLLQQMGGSLPLSTRLLMGFSTAVTRGWPLVLTVVLGVTLYARYWLGVSGNRARWHARRLHWPVSGNLERLIAGARYTRTLALALPSGVDMLAAMRLSRGAVENLALHAQLEGAEHRVREGATLATSVERALPPLAVQLLGAGEASGALAPLAARAADALDAEVQ